MREVSYTLDGRRRLVELAPAANHGTVYQIEQVAIATSGRVWQPTGRLVQPPRTGFAPAAWDAAHEALRTGRPPSNARIKPHARSVVPADRYGARP